MEENYLLAKKIVSEKFNSNDEYYYLYICALFGFFMKYPDYKELIIKVFRDTRIIIENKPIFEIQKNYDLSLISEEDLKEQDLSVCSYHGVSDTGFGYYIEDGIIKSIMDKPIVVCSSYDYSPALLLNAFVHEMNHILKGTVNSYGSKLEDNVSECYTRSGFSYAYFSYDRDTDILTQTEFYSVLDEVVNVFQTTEILEYILMLDGTVPDDGLQRYIDLLDKDEMKKNNGYDKCCGVFKRVWDKQVLKEILEEHLIDGDLSEISVKFDEAVGRECFDRIADSLDDLDYLFCANNQKKNMDKCYKQLDKLIKSITSYKIKK